MARTFPGALVPAVNPDGSVQWQGWQYEELLAHLTNDLVLDNFIPPSSLSWTPQWITPTLVNAWANVGSPFDTAAYLKDPLGFVHLKGYVQSGANGTVVFTLPPGYRPAAHANYPAWESSGVGQWAGVRVQSDGSVFIFMSAALQIGLGVPPFLAEL